MQKWPIERFFCDPAAPQSIEKLRRADVPTHAGMNKIPDGIRAVGACLRTGRLKCFRTCRNTIRESGLYHYDAERLLQVDIPLKADDHAMDALRYAISRIDRVREPHGMPPYEPPAEPEPPPYVQQRYQALTPRPEDIDASAPNIPLWHDESYAWEPGLR